MFERFTDRARRVLVLAQEEARMLNHNYIGTEHILLGLVREGTGVAAMALESLGISPEAVRQQVKEMMGQGQRAPSGHIPFNPRANKVLELSLRESVQVGHNYIGTEHILLGLVREGEGVAARVLVRLGADLDRVRYEVIQLLRAHAGNEPEAAGVRSPGYFAREDRRLLLRLLDRVTAMESRLSAIEQRVGTGPDARELDHQIDQARRDREAAASTQDDEKAAALLDKEKQLAAEKASLQQKWAAEHMALPALAEEVHRLSGEIERLGDLPRQQESGPQDGAA
jgi:hypothetical protein